MKKNLFNLLMFIIISVCLVSCSSNQHYTVLYVKYLGTTQIKTHETLIAKTPLEVTQHIKTINWDHCDSIKIVQIYKLIK